MQPVKDSGKRQEFETGSRRDTSEGKGMPSLISHAAMQVLAEQLEAGAVKYGLRNWEKGQPVCRYADSLYRHLWAILDRKTDENHLGALLFNAMGIVHTLVKIEEGFLPEELDDRPIREEIVRATT